MNLTLAEKMLHALCGDRRFFWENADPDIALEFPFAASIGMPTRVAGRENVEPYIDQIDTLLPGLTFRDVRLMPLADPDTVLLEYRGASPAANGYEQNYITIMRFAQGKLVLYREYWDTTELTRALGGRASTNL